MAPLGSLRNGPVLMGKCSTEGFLWEKSSKDEG